MLMNPPPGYSPFAINRQFVSPLGTPGVQGANVTGTKPTGAFAAPKPSLGKNSMGTSSSPNNAALLAALGR